MRKVSKLFSDLTKSVSSSSVQFLITLFTTPVMTRLYDPHSYATFGIIHTTATLFVGIGFLSLQNVYLQEKKARARAEVMHTIFWLLVTLVILAALAAAGMAIAGALHISAPISSFALVLLPLLVLTYGIRQMTITVAIKHAAFGSISAGQIAEPLCSRGSAIALGAAFGGHSVFMLASAAAGHMTTSLLLFKSALHGKIGKWRPHVKPFAILRRHAHFVFYNTFSQQVQPMMMLGVQLAIAAFFSGEVAGHYILAVSILTLPATILLLATGPAVYRHFIEIDHTKPKQLPQHFMKALVLYLLTGFCLFSPIFFFGEKIFAFAFSSKWTAAGAIASILSIAYVSSLTLMGVQSIFMVIHRLKLQFILELCTCTLTLVIAIVCFKFLAFNTALHCLVILWMMRSGLLLFTCVIVTFQHARKA